MTEGAFWGVAAAGLGIVAALILALLRVRKPRYRRQAIMTANEREFYRRLASAFPDCQIWPQVPILAMVRPDAREGSRAFWLGFRAVSNARVDWVIVQDEKILAIIELDDRSHDAEKDERRDRILASCGYRVLRFSSSQRPDSRQIREAVLRRGS